MKKVLLLLTLALVLGSASRAQRTKTARKADSTGTNRNSRDSSGHYKSNKYYHSGTDSTVRSNRP